MQCWWKWKVKEKRKYARQKVKITFKSLYSCNTIFTKGTLPVTWWGENPESLNKAKSSSFDNLNCKFLQQFLNSSALTFAIWRIGWILYLYFACGGNLWSSVHLALMRIGTQTSTVAISCDCMRLLKDGWSRIDAPTNVIMSGSRSYVSIKILLHTSYCAN